MKYPSQLLQQAEKIELVLLDVDGVLTDGTLLYTDGTSESKSFHTQDGFGLRLLKEAGIKTGIITARKSAVVTRRAEELQLDYIYQGTRDKLAACKEIVTGSNIGMEQIAYMGDDWLDLTLFSRVGLAVSPANGVKEVQEAAHFITPQTGGAGAVRDLCDLLLAARGVTRQLLQRYQG